MEDKKLPLSYELFSIFKSYTDEEESTERKISAMRDAMPRPIFQLGIVLVALLSIYSIATTAGGV